MDDGWRCVGMGNAGWRKKERKNRIYIDVSECVG